MRARAVILPLLLLSLALPLSAQDQWGGPEPPVEPGFAADKLYQMGGIDAVDQSDSFIDGDIVAEQKLLLGDTVHPVGSVFQAEYQAPFKLLFSGG